MRRRSKVSTATVSDEFQTEQDAITALRKLLPEKWILREQRPDFHIDYLVEIVDAGELTGINLGVQLKGARPDRNSKGPSKHSLKTKHLSYYVDKCTVPVFLVFVDVVKETAHWMFLQKFGLELKENWRSQTKITVKFDKKNTLSDRSAFIAAVSEAVQYTRNLHPGSIKAALTNAEKELALKDDRVGVKIDVEDGVQRITLNPKEDLSLTMNFKTANTGTIQKIKDFIEKGNDLTIKSSEIQISGSPHLEAVSEGDGDVLIQHRRETSGHVLLAWSETDVSAHIQVIGRFWTGLKYISFEAALPDAPLYLRASIPFESLSTREPFSMEVALRPQAWQIQPLPALAYFDSVYALVKALREGSRVSCRFFVKGNSFGKAWIDTSAFHGIQEFWELLETLRKARMLSSHFRVSPSVPVLGTIRNEDFEAVDELYAIVFEKGYRTKVPNLKLSLKVSGPVPPEAKLHAIKPIAMEVKDTTYQLFGIGIRIDKVQLQFTNLRLVQAEKLSDCDETQLSFAGTNDSEKFVRLALVT